ncbi:metallothionein-like protein type 2 [Pyrus communis]|uniref:metallothionein-like protein type 2 n=1 Tax=Pyrus communis TaxID=23211 RepID=UPI0035BF0025
MSSRCGGKCGCGPSCSCASDCNGCEMAPDLSHKEGSTTETLVTEVAPQKSHPEASEMGVAAKSGCKCGDNCTCNPCNCK